MLNHAIFNKKNQCYYKDKQFLLYVRDKRRVGKSRIVKSIHLEFCFLKQQKELVIAALTGAAKASVGKSTIYKVLGIDDCVSNQQCMVKNP